MIELTPEQWMDDALCRGADPGEFFPSDGVGVDHAQRVCAPCPVREQCLEFALKNRIEHGIWGGASERERRRILRRRKQGVSTPESESAQVPDDGSSVPSSMSAPGTDTASNPAPSGAY